MKKFILITLILSVSFVHAQETLSGTILYKLNQDDYPLEGASIYWLNTNKGTITNFSGDFKIEKTDETDLLVISYIGFLSDTLRVKSSPIIHFLKSDENNSLDEITVQKKRKTIQKSYLAAQNIMKVSSEELLKAACCNLSESFETNPTIDVNFSDALTGTKQIKMLGLESPYMMISEENIPMIRGASQAYGLTFIPGTWIESIQITKGAGSIVNGFESISGQINTELKKPFSDFPLFINLFGSQMGRLEANTHINKKVFDRISMGVYMHANSNNERMDQNQDSFLDSPLSNQINVMNRWQYTNPEIGLVSFFTWRYMQDQKQMGVLDFDPLKHRGSNTFWGSEIKTNRLDLSFKAGYVFPDLPYQSFGFQTAFSTHDQDSYYGLRIYDIYHESIYNNLLFNSIIGNTMNKFKVGVNFSYDRYVERVDNINYNRIDKSIGTFFEYTYNNNSDISFSGGLRFDNHNQIGSFITPRIHFRYNPLENFVLRISSGSGRKIANIFAENQRMFATNRIIDLLQNGSGVYGLDPELAWNYGLSILRSFRFLGGDFELVADYYITNFKNQILIDWEESNKISFYNLEGKSSSKSLQLGLDFSYREFLTFSAAYKNYIIKSNYNSGYLSKPLQPRNIIFFNTGLESTINNGSQWKWDLTINFIGDQRLVKTIRDPENLSSPKYNLLNSQITRVFSSKFEIYLGGENIGNYKQLNPIISSENPFSPNFDSSQIYAPIFGRMIYSGLRLKL
tara:strand:- start:2579 stop:4801 length:2223 start_codon:yes stop_codon:yes gene_type:complete